MRILVVTNLYPPHHLGGYGLACAGTVGAWRAAGHEVEVLTSTWRRDGIVPDAPGPGDERIERTLPIHWDNHELPSSSWGERLAMERQTRRVVEQTASRFRPDVISIWNAAALSFGQFMYWDRQGAPVVLVICDQWLSFGRDLDPWARAFSSQRAGRRLAARIVRRMTGLSTSVTSLGEPPTACFVSDFLARHAQTGHRWEFRHTAVIPQGIDHVAFPVTEPQRPTEWSGRLLYVGRLDPRKGVHTVIRALSRVPELRLEVIGSGAPEAERTLHELADHLDVHDRITWRGDQPKAFVREAHARSDALVFPSEWSEPFGMVPVEAMASGLPVVGTGTGGSREFLVDGLTCVRYRAGDVEALVGAISRLAADPELRERLTRNGMDVASWLSWDAFHERTLAWHSHAAGHGDGPPPTTRPALPPELQRRVPEPADVRIGIVNWNGGDHLGRCLAALPEALDGLTAEIVVVDNDSSDDSANLAANRSDVTLIRNDTNVGYARAMNQALAGSVSETLIALNPDTIPTPGSLRALTERLHDSSDIGLVTPQLVGDDGRRQQTVQSFPSIRLGLVANLLPSRFRSQRMRNRHLLAGAEMPTTSMDVPWAIGAVHVIRARAVDAEHPYRERWFIYVEDLDLCWRLRNAGWRVTLEPDIKVVHVGNVSGQQAFADRRMARYLGESYDWCRREKGRMFTRLYALLSTIGVLGQLLLGRMRGQGDTGLHRQLRHALAVNARTTVFGPPVPRAHPTQSKAAPPFEG